MIYPISADDISDCYSYGQAALAVWREARGEPYAGKVAVAEVIIERGRRRALELGDVVTQPKQFSSFNANDPQVGVYPDTTNAVWLECCRAVLEALNGSQVAKGATHFLNPDLAQPKWYNEKKVLVRIGNHAFLKADD